MLWLRVVMWWPLTGFFAEGKPSKEVIGILGSSATFLLETPSLYEKVYWSKGDVQVAFLRVGPPCEFYRFGAFASREVNISHDCRLLTIQGLIKEDSARYTARIPDPAGSIVRETFDLKVYSNTEGTSSLSPEAAIGVTIAAMIVAKVIITACFLAVWLTCTK